MDMARLANNVSILRLEGSQSSTCGYCSPPGQRSESYTYHSIGVTALSLTCSDYQNMMDRGWRRSGTYCYKPDMRRTCCPQHTIKLDALQLTPTKKQRKVVYRWNRFVLDGVGESEGGDVDMAEPSSKGKTSRKPPPFSLVDSVHASETAFTKPETPPKHKFEIILEPSSYTEEKFELYCHYQQNIHKETKPHRPSSFTHFLVDSPLKSAPIVYERTPPKHLPRNFGSCHQLYRLNGELIAVSVIDILPSCVSSVYFMYNDKWEKFSLGKLSALREAALAREMHEYGAKDVKYLYMGYYIHSCQKMRYKGEYSPSFLLDPEEYAWCPLKECIKLLDAHRYACFVHPEHSLKTTNDIPPEMPPKDVSEEDSSQISLFHDAVGTVRLSTILPLLSSEYHRDFIFRAIEGLGLELSKQVILMLQ